MRGPNQKDGRLSPAQRRAEFRTLCAAFDAAAQAGAMAGFLKDIATPAELDALAERWRIARMLDGGAASYRDIAEATGASTTTVARVARFLREEPHAGYRSVLDRTQKKIRK